MKKILSLLVVGVLALSLAACKKSESTTTTAKGNEIALITDVGTIDDKSFNQGSWEGVVDYAKKSNKTHKYYQPAAKDTKSYLESIKLAVSDGAKVIVAPGFLFEEAIYEAQDLYKDVKFILIDATPKKNNEEKIKENVVSLLYAEHESGFLAGYAAVKDGYTNLGYMGGMALPAVIKFGYGYIQGAEYAAKEDGKDIAVEYTYLNTFGPSADVQAKASAWYQNGTEVIFAAAGGAGNSVMQSATTANKKVIGVDVDQSSESATVVTSAMKGLKTSVSAELEKIYTNKFKGGQALVLSAKEDAVGLPLATSKFTKFTKEQYDAIFAKVKSGEIKIKSEFTTDAKADVDGLGLTKVKVNITLPAQN